MTREEPRSSPITTEHVLSLGLPAHNEQANLEPVTREALAAPAWENRDRCLTAPQPATLNQNFTLPRPCLKHPSLH